MAVVPGTAGAIPERMAMGRFNTAPTYKNTSADIMTRRMAQTFYPAALTAQFMVDRGGYTREAVGPVEYTEGNIKKSNQVTGLPGYNHPDGVPIPDSPDDMSQIEYLKSIVEGSPQNVMALQGVVGTTLNQNFLQNDSALLPKEYPSPMLNMQNNLLTMATRVKGAKKK